MLSVTSKANSSTTQTEEAESELSPSFLAAARLNAMRRGSHWLDSYGITARMTE